MALKASLLCISFKMPSNFLLWQAQKRWVFVFFLTQFRHCAKPYLQKFGMISELINRSTARQTETNAKLVYAV